MRTAPVAGGFSLGEYQGQAGGGRNFRGFRHLHQRPKPVNRADIFAAIYQPPFSERRGRGRLAASGVVY